MKIGVYSNPIKDSGFTVRDTVFEAAERNGVTAELYTPGDKYNFIISIGGDGTILRIARDSARYAIPILGVNMGTVGFLTEVEPADIDAAIEKLIKREYLLERRSMLDAVVCGNHVYALNDVVMRSCDGHIISMEVAVGGEIIDRFTCDGYIAATPTGSTAYSLSAGGSVISPNTPVMALTPVNPHTLRTRPIVVGSFETVVLKNNGVSDAGVFVDGNCVATVNGGGSVSVTSWDMSALFVRFDKTSFYSKLLDKLNDWSVSGD